MRECNFDEFLGFLNSIFDVLYDNDVLSADAFESWKKSDDQTEGKGKQKSNINNILNNLFRFFNHRRCCM